MNWLAKSVHRMNIIDFTCKLRRFIGKINQIIIFVMHNIALFDICRKVGSNNGYKVIRRPSNFRVYWLQVWVRRSDSPPKWRFVWFKKIKWKWKARGRMSRCVRRGGTRGECIIVNIAFTRNHVLYRCCNTFTSLSIWLIDLIKSFLTWIYWSAPREAALCSQLLQFRKK